MKNSKIKYVNQLPAEIKYKGIIFIKTPYTSTHVKTNETLFEYRTHNDSRRLWMNEKGEFFED